MGGILEVAAGNMANTCQAVSCDSASLRSCLAGLSTREASAEVGQLLRCRRVRTVLARTYDHHFSARTYQLRLFKAVTGQISGHHKNGCSTGHDQARLNGDKI